MVAECKSVSGNWVHANNICPQILCLIPDVVGI